MNSKNKLLLMILILLACSFGLTQEIFDPIYADIDIWAAQGYCKLIYNIRPYAPQVLLAILEEVSINGDERAKEKAQHYIKKLTRYDIGFEINSNNTLLAGTEGDYRGLTGIAFNLFLEPVDKLLCKVYAGAYLIDGQSKFYPYGTGEPIDIHEDSVYLLPPLISGDNTAILYTLTSYSWYGKSSFWISAGLGRNSAGPFFDNGIFIGPQARQTANWGLNFTAGQFTFSTLLLQLTAVTGNANKYAIYHDYSFRINDNLKIGLVETVIFGGEFKPQYLLPITAFFYQQSMTSGALYADNSLAGGYIVWNMPNGLVVRGSLFLDDSNPFDYVKLLFDTKTIGAMQIGFLWAPLNRVVKKISGDYTAVFPYMYAHHYTTGEDNYTHMGASLGAGLLPNSDRFELALDWNLLNLATTMRILRHGNASEGVYSGTGDYWDDGWVNGEPTYQPPYPSGTTPKYFRFLSQQVIQTVFQFEIKTTVELLNNILLDVGYCFEYHSNYNLQQGVDANLHYLSVLCKYVF